MTAARRALDAATGRERQRIEEDFQADIIRVAHLNHWYVAHFRSVRIQRKGGSVYYATPAAADGEGWPDLVLCRAPTILYRELKSDTGKVEDAQTAWLEMLAHCGQDVGVWRPRDWDTLIIPALTTRAR